MSDAKAPEEEREGPGLTAGAVVWAAGLNGVRVNAQDGQKCASANNVRT